MSQTQESAARGYEEIDVEGLIGEPLRRTLKAIAEETSRIKAILRPLLVDTERDYEIGESDTTPGTLVVRCRRKGTDSWTESASLLLLP